MGLLSRKSKNVAETNQAAPAPISSNDKKALPIATDNNKAPSKAEEALAERNLRDEESALGAPPPVYSESSTSTSAPQAQHASLADAVSADVHALAVGDPKETITVPMIHSSETINWRKYMSKDRSVITHTVIVRKMPREHYLKHYAKDEEGNYVGTEKPAVDAGLVFVPSKSTPEDLLQQVNKVAFGKQHYAMDFSAGATMIPFMMNTGGGM